MSDYATARMNMVESQIRPNRVSDEALLAAFEEVPRERFLPEHLRAIAYIDEDLKVAPRRYMMEPMVLARLLETAMVGSDDAALVVGAGPGYACAVLAHLAATVVGVESDTDLARRADSALTALAVDNAVVVEGSLKAGHPAHGPYNVILINGAVATIPDPLRDQLADGGRLVTVIRDGQGMGKGTLVERFGDAFGERHMFDAATPVLPGFDREPGFVF